MALRLPRLNAAGPLTGALLLAAALHAAAETPADPDALLPGEVPPPSEQEPALPLPVPDAEREPDPPAVPEFDSRDIPDLAPGDRLIPGEEWRAMTTGKVVWYAIEGRLWGREFFHPNGTQSIFVASDGTCLEGVWWEGNGVYCFSYEGLHCFRHVLRGDQILIVSITGGEVQTVERITDDGPLACTPPMLM
ncbi:MAG: hypothetical protein ACFBRM_00920 [Pikeienuella sp.]